MKTHITTTTTVTIFASKIITFFTVLAFLQCVEGSIGVNYGTIANNLPPAAQVAQFLLKSTLINRVRLFDLDSDLITAFANTGIAVTITIPNEQIVNLTSTTFAQQWIISNVQRYIPDTNIIRILVGNEVLSSAAATADTKLMINSLVPAMQTLQSALVSLTLGRPIQVSTPHSLAILSESTPPSNGKFKQGYVTNILKSLLKFLRETNSPFMINPYPFFGCSENNVDYALFRTNEGVIDENTKLVYKNMLDAQLDATFSAMKLLGFDDLEIVIAETGWPSRGDVGVGDEVGIDAVSAGEYNGKLIRHVSSGVGTPLMPRRTFETYVFALFNENLKPGPEYERNFGLFRPDFSPVYDIGILRPTARGYFPPKSEPATSSTPGGNSRKWCVPKTEATDESLQRNIDYVCGGLGLDCREIKMGGTCFVPDSVRAHAAYAMNMYYQSMGRNLYNCDFKQTGILSVVDPSYGNCRY